MCVISDEFLFPVVRCTLGLAPAVSLSYGLPRLGPAPELATVRGRSPHRKAPTPQLQSAGHKLFGSDRQMSGRPKRRPGQRERSNVVKRKMIALPPALSLPSLVESVLCFGCKRSAVGCWISDL